MAELHEHLLLFFSGISRYSSTVAQTKIDNIKERRAELRAMQQMVDEAINILRNPATSIADFGELLHEGWSLKKRLSDRVSTEFIDGIYDTARGAGAIGGKVLGAGGGGFMLFFAPPERHAAIREALNTLVHVPFHLENAGSRIVVYQPNGL